MKSRTRNYTSIWLYFINVIHEVRFSQPCCLITPENQRICDKRVIDILFYRSKPLGTLKYNSLTVTERNVSPTPPTPRHICSTTVVSDIPREQLSLFRVTFHASRFRWRTIRTNIPPQLIPCSHKYVPSGYINIISMCTGWWLHARRSL